MEQIYSYDGHGHSRKSDGASTPSQIVDAAVRRGVHILGLSDHDSTAGLPEMLATVDRYNKDGVKILPIASVEISTKQGHVLVAIPDRDMADKMLCDSYHKEGGRKDAIDVVEYYVNMYDALCVLLHPECKPIHGMSIEAINHLLQKIDGYTKQYVGIEIHNWMADIFPGRHEVEQKLKERNTEWGLSEFSFTDYHIAAHVGQATTAMRMTELSPVSFKAAILGKRMKARKNWNAGNVFAKVRRLIVGLAAEARTRLTK